MRTSQININYSLILKLQHPNGHHCMNLGMHMKYNINISRFVT
jgi:hypothetical protein